MRDYFSAGLIQLKYVKCVFCEPEPAGASGTQMEEWEEIVVEVPDTRKNLSGRKSRLI